MNSLDELFSEALDGAAMPATEERRRAVAEVTVQGARRKRRARAIGQAVGVVAVAGIATAAAALLLGGNPTPPASQPPPVATVTAPPDAASALDPRLAPAPAMTGEDWARVNAAWDVELASFIGGGKDGYGSVLAIYLTPPDGSRKLAYSNSTTFIEAPTLLGFDPQTRSVMLFGGQPSGGARALNLLTGALMDVPLDLPDPALGAAPLGKLSNGDSLFVVVTADSHSTHTAHVFRTFNNTAVPVTAGRIDVSPVWEDRLVVKKNGEFTFLDADGVPPASIPGADACEFGVWNTDGTFIAICGDPQVRSGDYVRVNPETGEVTQLSTDSSVLEFHAIDRQRSWSDDTTTSLVPYTLPVTVRDGKHVADLSEGFAQTPKTYGIIFGVGR